MTKLVVKSVMKSGSNIKGDKKDYDKKNKFGVKGSVKPAKGSGHQVKVFPDTPEGRKEAKAFAGGGTIKKVSDKIASDPSKLMSLFSEGTLINTLESGSVVDFKEMVKERLDTMVQDRIQLKRIEIGSSILGSTGE
jgi:hypothetical protein